MHQYKYNFACIKVENIKVWSKCTFVEKDSLRNEVKFQLDSDHVRRGW